MAIHTMVTLAVDPDRLITTREIASELRISETHLSKVLQRLAKFGLVKSVRGPGGGTRLHKPPNQVSLLEILETVDGPMDDNECLLSSGPCDRVKCIFCGLVNPINTQVREYLTKTTIQKLAKSGVR
jgi:Rrf2 family protein